MFQFYKAQTIQKKIFENTWEMSTIFRVESLIAGDLLLMEGIYIQQELVQCMISNLNHHFLNYHYRQLVLHTYPFPIKDLGEVVEVLEFVKMLTDIERLDKNEFTQ